MEPLNQSAASHLLMLVSLFVSLPLFWGQFKLKMSPTSWKAPWQINWPKMTENGVELSINILLSECKWSPELSFSVLQLERVLQDYFTNFPGLLKRRFTSELHSDVFVVKCSVYWFLLTAGLPRCSLCSPLLKQSLVLLMMIQDIWLWFALCVDVGWGLCVNGNQCRPLSNVSCDLAFLCFIFIMKEKLLADMAWLLQSRGSPRLVLVVVCVALLLDNMLLTVVGEWDTETQIYKTNK